MGIPDFTVFLQANVRVQMLPIICLRCNAIKVNVVQRSLGALTGTPLAGLLSCVPVQELLASRTPMWEPWGFKIPGRTFTASTFVDNVFAASSSRSSYPTSREQGTICKSLLVFKGFDVDIVITER